MTRDTRSPALRVREERVDALIGDGKDRALRASDLDGAIASLVRSIIAKSPPPLGFVLPTANVLRPDPGTVIGTGIQAAVSTATPSANQERIMPFAAPFDMPIDQLGISITAGIAAANVKITVYESDAAGRPTKLVHETGDIDASGAATTMIAANLKLFKGRCYWIGARFSAAVTFRTLASSSYSALSWTTTASPSPLGALTRSLAYATPATDWDYSSANHALAAPALILMRLA